MAGFYRLSMFLFLSVITGDINVGASRIESLSRSKRGASSISIGPPTVYKGPGNHSVEVGQNFQLYCKIKANPLAHVVIKFNPVNNPVMTFFPKYGSSPTGGSTIVLLDLMDLQLDDEGRYTCFGENKHGTVEAHGWLKFAKACNCNTYGVAFPQKPCDDDGNCVCRENVGGEQCDECQIGFFNFPFCQSCECNPWGTVDQSLNCNQKTGECDCLPDRSIFNSIKCDGCAPGEYFNVVTNKCQPCRCYPDGSVSKDCDYISGQCECKSGFEGEDCSQCQDGFYSIDDGCKPCQCVVENTIGLDKRCDSLTGQCVCQEGLVYADSRSCASCPEDTYFKDDKCVPCGCNPTGTEQCTSTGECSCKENFTGDKCEKCEENHYASDIGSCGACMCNQYGTSEGSLQCDADGNCPCKVGQDLIDGQKCDGCPPGQTLSQNAVDKSTSCMDCNCNAKGSVSYDCDLYTEQCDCKASVVGLKCDECQAGTYGFSTFGECKPCNCDPANSVRAECDEESGQCSCLNNIVYTNTRTCTGCPTGQYSTGPGICEPCLCDMDGSVSNQCDIDGQCSCQPTVRGPKCDECKPGFFNLVAGGCERCNCNKFGVVDENEPCDPVTGQCSCKEGQDKISSRTCDGCPEGFYMNVNDPTQCFSCECHPFGSDNQNCDLYSGACDCSPDVVGEKCDACAPGFYGLNLVSIQECVPCECDPEGSTSTSCDVFGECECKDGYGTIDSRTCEGCPAGLFSEEGTCVPCACDPKGSISSNCQSDGHCFCGEHLDSPKCDVCESGHYFGDPNLLGCIPCGCDQSGTIDASGECDTSSGQCDCKEDGFFIDTRTCDACQLNEYKLNNMCTDCGCHPKGSTALQCDFLTGQCPCGEGAEGTACDSCEDGYYSKDEVCVPCQCEVENTLQGAVSCDATGQCLCTPDIVYSDSKKCVACQEGTFEDSGKCSPCDCHVPGSHNNPCDIETGQCSCLDNVQGRRCDRCIGERYGINSGEGCKPCECNVYGTVNRASSCEQESGQCDCVSGHTVYDSRTCDGCVNNFQENEFIDPVTRTCTPCGCLEAGSQQANCTLYEGQCDCKTGVVGDKCTSIGEAQGDVVLLGELAELSCSLNDGEADRVEWIGPNRCVSEECGHDIIENHTFLSLSYAPEQDEAFTCRFVFGDEYQDHVAPVDVITYELPSVRVQKGQEVTLTAVVGGMGNEPSPGRGIEWRNKGEPCTEKRCKLDGHEVTESMVKVDGQWTLTSEISVGPVYESGKYTALFKYKGKTFRTSSLVTVYECNCDPIGSKNNVCDSFSLQCDCKTRFEGVNCDQCKDEFYEASSGCLACDCETDHAMGNVCDKVTGQCACSNGIPFIDARRCEKCRSETYLDNDSCVSCGCLPDNTVLNSNECDDIGQCDCVADFPYLDSRTCERCSPGTFLEGDGCQDCGCYPEGSITLVCSEDGGMCLCKDRYQGEKCDMCEAEFHSPTEGCLPCNCDPENSEDNFCDTVTGQCTCFEESGPFIDSQRCVRCTPGSYLVEGSCVPCGCVTENTASNSNVCDDNGQCNCLDGFPYVDSTTCERCPSRTFLGDGKCEDCGCYPEGSSSLVCAENGGECSCKDRYQGDKCDSCKAEFYSPSEGCLPCNCDPENSDNNLCDSVTGQCSCLQENGPFIDTQRCVRCTPGTYLVEGSCVPCGCVTENTASNSNVCDDNGQCHCLDGFPYVDSSSCERCPSRTFLGDGKCEDCGCSPEGSISLVCSEDKGMCLCKNHYQGEKCDSCKAEFYSPSEGCLSCNCDPENSDNNLCDSVTGQCSCLQENGPFIDTQRCGACGDNSILENDKCVKCPKGTSVVDNVCTYCPDGRYFLEGSCADCGCFEKGSVDNVCHPVTGACICNDRFEEHLCDRCQAGFHSPEAGCLECGCVPESSLSEICNIDSGQCRCKSELGPFLDPLTCLTCPGNHMLSEGECVECKPGQYVDNNLCLYCRDGQYLEDGICKPCGCYMPGSETAVCSKVTGLCDCSNGYMGGKCVDCEDEFYQMNGECMACACYLVGAVDNVCVVDSGECTCLTGYEANDCSVCVDEFYKKNGECIACGCNSAGSADNACDVTTGQCTCLVGYTGDQCEQCQAEYYPLNGECEQCACYALGSEDNMCSEKGECTCRTGYQGDKCLECEQQYHFNTASGECNECACYLTGAQDNVCAYNTGACDCLAGYGGDKCNMCQEEFYKKNGECLECGCNSVGSADNVCDVTNGQCTCLTGYTGDKCDQCQVEFYLQSGECAECRCYIPGSEDDICDVSSGKCDCMTGYEGDKCFMCQDGFHKDEKECVECGCVVEHTAEGSISCSDNGQCECVGDRPYIDPAKCKPCLEGLVVADGKCIKCAEDTFIIDYQCFDCACHDKGTVSCDPFSGDCTCKNRYIGDFCDQCVDGFYSLDCDECACSLDSTSNVCDKTTGQCICPENYAGRTCDQCAPGYFGEQCEACLCDPTFSSSSVCDSKTGQCPCADQSLFYKDSRTCVTCPFNHRVSSDSSCVECDRGSTLHEDNTCKPCDPGTYEQSGVCVDCTCDPHGTSSCDRVTGDCTCNSLYIGELCNSCVAGRYAPQSGCLECQCDPLNTDSDVCDGITGQCVCTDTQFLFDTRTCEQCPEGQYLYNDLCLKCPPGHFARMNTCILCDLGYYLRHGECTECRCNPTGSLSPTCDQVTGVCSCDEKHDGEKCQNCRSGYFSASGLSEEQRCQACECVLENTLGGFLEECSWTGQCTCKGGLVFVNDRTCETCPEGQVVVDGRCMECFDGNYYNDGSCNNCMCMFPGSVDNVCDSMTGSCLCNMGYTGPLCSECDDGYFMKNNKCVTCECDPERSETAVCDKETGQCLCRAPLGTYDVSRTCFSCPEYNYFSKTSGKCNACNCNMAGSPSAKCDSDGNCECLPNVEGRKCDKCKEFFYDISSGTGCRPCGCNPYGVEYLHIFNAKWQRERDMSCDPITGQCNCEEFKVSQNKFVKKNKYETRRCDGCPNDQYHKSAEDRTCVDCKCHPDGSLDFECHLYTGFCKCNPQIVGKHCDTRGCGWGIWQFAEKCNITNFTRCRGTKEKTRVEYITKGGDFSTIVKEAECVKVETAIVPCRDKEC